MLVMSLESILTGEHGDRVTDGHIDQVTGEHDCLHTGEHVRRVNS